jgi:hypothetical protein
MAHGVKRSQSIKLHQALHGYAEGHRQLAASAALKQRDVKKMLVLSDLSGPGAQIDEAGYLTGYPLTDSKKYALARTWAAPEMSRPGCVWSHTLLIDFADLATLADATPILALFRRPMGGNSADYGISLKATTGHRAANLTRNAESYARRLVASLYVEPHQRVVAARPSGFDVDLVVMAIWAQQWPRLRRAFRFSTLSIADRSSEEGAFDLQLLPSSDRTVRSRFPGAIEATDVGWDEPWLDDALSDLMRPDASGLRAFLRRIGGDVASGREAFRSLCRLHGLIEDFETNAEAVDTAISLLEDDLGSVQARAARGIVASAALNNPNQLNSFAVDFLVRHLDLADLSAVKEGSESLGHVVWKRDPGRFEELLEGGNRQHAVVERAIATLSIKDLIKGLRQAPQLSPSVVSHRPDLLTSQSFWRRGLVPGDLAFSTLADHPELRSAGVAAMIAANRDDLAPRAIREVGALDVLRLISKQFHVLGSHGQHLVKWVRVAVSDPKTVAQFLAEQKAPSRAFLSTIAALMLPDAVPNDYGVDPWLLAVQAANRSDPKDAPIFLSAYLLSRALGAQSRNPGELAQIGFEATYKAASTNRLPDDAWNMLQIRLPWSLDWLEWDRCPRIRAAVSELFVRRNLSPQLFAHIAKDNRLFAELADTVARRSRGRQFLRRVRRWMKKSGPKRYSRRIQTIDKLIG